MWVILKLIIVLEVNIMVEFSIMLQSKWIMNKMFAHCLPAFMLHTLFLSWDWISHSAALNEGGGV
jgi:hypothetical protein